MTLSTETFNRIIDTLVPFMSDTGDRRALVESALHGCPVLQ
jgi:hypothetical protein